MMGRRFKLGGPPLALQIMGLLIGGLLVAQLVTLVLTVVLPPSPPPQYELTDIAATLGGASDEGSGKHLQRIVQKGPPDVHGPGWLVSENSRRELAHLMGVEEDRVSLAFYTPLPFAGVTGPRTLAMANDGVLPPFKPTPDATRPASFLRMQYIAPPGGMALPGGAAIPSAPMMPALRPGDRPAGMTPPNGAMPGGFRRGTPGEGGRPPFPLPRGVGAIDRSRSLLTIQGTQGQAAVRLPDYANGGGTLVRPDGTARPEGTRGTGTGGTTVATGTTTGGYGSTPGNPGQTVNISPNGEMHPGYHGAGGAVRTELFAQAADVPPALLGANSGMRPQGMMMAPPAINGERALLAPVPALGRGTSVQTVPQTGTPVITQAPTPRIPAVPAPLTVAPPPPALTESIVAPYGRQPSGQPAAAPAHVDAVPAGPPIQITPEKRALFGLAPAPFVEGDFVAALKLGDGSWAVVQPAAEPFPNAWQRRVLLWFVIALALVAPVGWLFARRLVKPIDRFAGAAEQLGRDPAAEIGALDGPAEIGRAAHAFNLMQNRLRAFVDDRTAMVGAISHDLRTPLTRMRFRLEDVEDDEVRDGLLLEVEEMEAMINQVINFLRDASAPAKRERLDLATLMEDVVEDVRLIGGDVTVEHVEAARVEVDVLGMKRLFDNLLENAVKYGIRARVRLRTDLDEAVAEIIDEGPGLPEEEIERVFEPFYRSESARNSDKSGSGLGLAVCRSIARAHGGDIRLKQTEYGFAAELRVPLVYGSEKPVLA